MTAEDARIARDLWAKLGRPEMAWPSAAQLLAFMRQAPDHIAEGVAARLLADQDTAHRCVHIHDEHGPEIHVHQSNGRIDVDSLPVRRTVDVELREPA